MYHPAIEKSPRTAGLLSLLGGPVSVQGLGQFYNGQYIKGFAFLGVGIFSSSVWISSFDGEKSKKIARRQWIYGGFVYLSSLGVSTYDAYQSANEISEKQLSIRPTNMGNVPVIKMAYIV